MMSHAEIWRCYRFCNPQPDDDMENETIAPGRSTRYIIEPSYLDLDNCREKCREGKLQRYSDARDRYGQYSDHGTVLKRTETDIRPLPDTPNDAAEANQANE